MKKGAVSPAKQYDEMVSNGRIKDDAAQRDILAQLIALQEQLTAKPSLFKRKQEVSGLYIWGNVGRGKSMLMDLFYASTALEKKKRVHFHAFMQGVHERIHEIRHAKSGADPVITLAREIADDTTLLCFDELQATDVADATLLFRLFSEIFAAGVVVVSTSNHPPVSLYTGGVQKERFHKFIALIEEHMKVCALSSPLDYRSQHPAAVSKTYFYPLGPKADKQLADAVSRVSDKTHPHTEYFTVKGRKVPLAFYDDVTGQASFKDLCETALGAADYLALAKRVKTLILTGIPKLPAEKRNEAKRFVTLIDALYEHKVQLLITAEGPPEAIYTEGDGAFEFARTVSRLKEMQSEKWLEN